MSSTTSSIASLGLRGSLPSPFRSNRRRPSRPCLPASPSLQISSGSLAAPREATLALNKAPQLPSAQLLLVQQQSAKAAVEQEEVCAATRRAGRGDRRAEC
ncbi:hypothetical protein BCR35DRAFT_164295 [Leucosporidium creatinivorum]|uniref:Uncharacterized protein n=1 Tax=Leucosporidium creatinivorum TaxID=106004 RepID=A0A1Y2EKZ9_9BASI|nr:hypothetical protein BCR35DRAFT_164295 [Leucosporidium creatinivorum]